MDGVAGDTHTTDGDIRLTAGEATIHITAGEVITTGDTHITVGAHTTLYGADRTTTKTQPTDRDIHAILTQASAPDRHQAIEHHRDIALRGVIRAARHREEPQVRRAIVTDTTNHRRQAAIITDMKLKVAQVRRLLQHQGLQYQDLHQAAHHQAAQWVAAAQ